MTVVAAQARFVNDALSNLGQEIVVGGFLSLLVILVFLRDWRASLAIGLIVPLSVMVALVVLQLLDVTVNILSLGGLALASASWWTTPSWWPRPPGLRMRGWSPSPPLEPPRRRWQAR